VALGFAEFLPSKAYGHAARMFALDRAQETALRLAMAELHRLLRREPHGALAKAVGDRDSAAAMRAWYLTIGVKEACHKFATCEVERLLPELGELEALEAAAGGCTHVLKGEAYAARMAKELGHVPRHAMDLTILHACGSSLDEAVSFTVAHGRQRSRALHEPSMARTRWQQNGFPWLSRGKVQGGETTACVGLARVTKAG
jgi:hypothetical protein